MVSALNRKGDIFLPDLRALSVVSALEALVARKYGAPAGLTGRASKAL